MQDLSESTFLEAAVLLMLSYGMGFDLKIETKGLVLF